MKAHDVEGGSLHPGVTKRFAAKETADISAKRSRFSREVTTGRILDAAEDLFSRRDPAKVTMREIAEAAGVTHPLVHQYIGSKSDVLAAVVERGAPVRHEIIAAHSDLRQLLGILTLDIVDRRVHSRAIIRSAMDGIEYAPIGDRIKNGAALLSLAREAIAEGRTRPTPAVSAMDPRVVMAATTALACGWAAVEDMVVTMYDLEGEDMSDVRRQVGEIVMCMSDLMLPAAETPLGDS